VLVHLAPEGHQVVALHPVRRVVRRPAPGNRRRRPAPAGAGAHAAPSSRPARRPAGPITSRTRWPCSRGSR
jgi:hypothetical protein